ncbi:MAG: 3-phosphoshikimate 1-carboxyvinyltransferase, partial [Nitrosopumilus sp.]
EINTENSGTTMRIASAIASLFSEEITLTGDSSLQKRPMQPLLDALTSMGAECISTDGKPPIRIKGKIVGGDVKIPGNLSSQFISALLICAPLTENGINLTIEGNLVSKPYLDATISTMRKFGVTVQTLIPYKRYNISPQIYKECTFTVPIDFSSLALLLSANVLCGEDITIKGNIGNLPQGDEIFIDILEQLGVEVTVDDEQIKIKTPEKLRGGKFDLSNSPDLLPPLAILALKSSDPIEIFNVKHARLKETDRIAIVSRELVKLGIKIQEKDDGLILESSEKMTGADLNSEEDHRLFMAFCIAGMYVGNCTVTDPESVIVSYPNFVEEMKRMGANIHIQ